MTPLRPETWYTAHEAATQCRRSVSTIRNLVSKHQLPRRLLWEVRNRLRKRVMMLSPETVAYLQRITLHGERPSTLQKPRA